LRNYFQTNDFTADVFIQLCYDLKDQPINKLNVEWKNSPYLKIGEVKINKDSLLDPVSAVMSCFHLIHLKVKLFFSLWENPEIT
jgi:hypothetical protein